MKMDKRYWIWLVKVMALFSFLSCQDNGKSAPEVEKNVEVKEILSTSIQVFEDNYKKILKKNTSYENIPSGCSSDSILNKVEPKSWVSGFFPGSLWYLYELTSEESWKQQATLYTESLSGQQFNKGTHDLGFMMYNSFGNGYKCAQYEKYTSILLESAKSLASRYNDKVGCIKSWDFPGWWEQYPVIIDNMMNLELLMWAYNYTNNQRFKEIAIKHSKNTALHHFINDSIAFHVVDYDTITGQVLNKGTFQGHSDSSAWARGQAWAIYGFTYIYKETGIPVFLNTAQKAANYFIKNLPDDYVPYWDFMAPDIPNEPKDASSAAIAASAFIELSGLVNEGTGIYMIAAENILLSLRNNYMIKEHDNNCGFVIKHNVVSKPHDAGVDVFLNYADYYYLEACLRYFEN